VVSLKPYHLYPSADLSLVKPLVQTRSADHHPSRVEEIETPQILMAWKNVLDLIESLKPTKIITGHLEAGWDFDAAADLAHNRKYLQLFTEKITSKPKDQRPKVDELYSTFQDAFPKADKNLGFFLGHLSDQFGVDGGLRENLHKKHNVGARTKEYLEGYVIGN
jgi:hypothetical protein